MFFVATAAACGAVCSRAPKPANIMLGLLLELPVVTSKLQFEAKFLPARKHSASNTAPHLHLYALCGKRSKLIVSYDAKGLVTAETIEVVCNHNCNKTTMSQSIITLRLMRKVRCNKNFKCNFCVLKQRHADFWLRNSLLRFFSDNLFVFCKCCVKSNNTGLLSVKWSSVFIWNPASEY